MFLFMLTDSGEKQGAPIVTIPGVKIYGSSRFRVANHGGLELENFEIQISNAEFYSGLPPYFS
jgi:hypothetical protein